MTRTFQAIFVNLALLLATATAKLVVFGPQELIDTFKGQDKTILANYANFGHIPYGQSLIGQIYFDRQHPDGCSNLKLTTSGSEKQKTAGLKDSEDIDFQAPDSQQQSEEEKIAQDAFATKIVLVERGNCTFVTKVRNAERAGASLVVVIDSRVENITNVVMGDDGTGTGIRIPSMLIGRDSGQKLKDFALNSGKPATLQAEFVMRAPDNVVEMELWFSSNNVLALDFLKQFSRFMPRLTTYVDFKPHFVTWGCPSCSADVKENECFGDGKYCAPNTKKSKMTGSYIRGRDVLLENLRERCLIETAQWYWNEKAWWDYMKHVHENCYDYVTEDCSKLAHEAIGYDYDHTMDCVRRSFEGGDINSKSENTILKENHQQWLEYGTHFWPSVTINKITYRGDITPANILEAVCAGLYSKPSVCLDFYQEENITIPVKEESIITAELLIIVMVSLLVVNFALIYAYRRCAKREMEQDIGFQVSSAVSQYIAVSQTQMNESQATDE